MEPVCTTTSFEATAVTLSFPAGPEHIRLARLVASGLVAPLDYGIDDVEDLRIAVDELCALVVAHAEPTGTLVIAFEIVDGEVQVQVRAPARADAPALEVGIEAGIDVEVDELSRLILLAAADDHGINCRHGEIVGHLRKRPARADR